MCVNTRTSDKNTTLQHLVCPSCPSVDRYHNSPLTMESAPNAAAAPGNSPADGEGQQPPYSAIIQTLNYVMFFFLFQNIIGTVVQKFAAPQNSAVTQSQFNDNVKNTVPINGMDGMIQQKPYRVDEKPMCIWKQGTVMDLDVVISDSSSPPYGWTLTTDNENAVSENKVNPRRTKLTLLKDSTPLASWRQENLILGGLTHAKHTPNLLTAFGSSSNQEMNYRNDTLTVSLTDSLWNNETHLYAHVRLMRRVYRGHNTDGQELRKEDVLVKKVELTRHRKRKKKRDGT